MSMRGAKRRGNLSGQSEDRVCRIIHFCGVGRGKVKVFTRVSNTTFHCSTPCHSRPVSSTGQTPAGIQTYPQSSKPEIRAERVRQVCCISVFGVLHDLYIIPLSQECSLRMPAGANPGIPPVSTCLTAHPHSYSRRPIPRLLFFIWRIPNKGIFA